MLQQRLVNAAHAVDGNFFNEQVFNLLNQNIINFECGRLHESPLLFEGLRALYCLAQSGVLSELMKL